MANLLSLEDTKDFYNLYYYGVKPSWALAVVTTFLFTCVTLVHLVLLFFKRSWFLIPLIIGALCTSNPETSTQNHSSKCFGDFESLLTCSSRSGSFRLLIPRQSSS
jgi:hypothetical protein